MKEHGLESILGAAYLLTDRAYAELSGDRKKAITVRLRGKSALSAKGLRALAAEFEAELATQKVRWAIAKNNLPVRESIAQMAVRLANAPAQPLAPAPADQLNDEQRREIERLIAEVEEEIRLMNEKKASNDPKRIAASWEEKQQGRVESKRKK